MLFKPAESSDNIKEFYKRYLLTTFKTNNETYNKQLEQELNQNNAIAKGPFINMTDPYEKGKSIADLVQEKILAESFLKLPELKPQRPLYQHQVEAITKAYQNKNLVITTGTGSGKTECFLIPVINQLLKEQETGTLDAGVRTLIIYPMNALVNDQIRRLRDIFKDVQDDCKITFGRFTGETKEKEADAVQDFVNREGQKPIKNEIISREKMRETPPNILITNYAMLEYLLLRPTENVFFNEYNAPKWQYIVFDEAHTYIGAKGIEVGTLIRRVKAKLNNPNIKFMLTSATLGSKGEKDNPDIVNFAELLSGAKFDDSSIVRSKTKAPEFSNNTTEINFSIYKELAEKFRKNSSYQDKIQYLKDNHIAICEMGNEKETFEKSLYNMILNDKFYIKVRKELLNNTQQLTEIAPKLNITQDDFTDFILVASNAIVDGDKIFEAKYHMFLRGIDGVFVTLKPTEKLFITKRETYKETPYEDEYKVFQVSFCNNCNALYLTGQTVNGYFTQKTYYSDDYQPEVYLYDGDYDPDEYDEITDEQQENDYIICSKCGKIQRATLTDKNGNKVTKICEHTSENYNKLVKVKDKGGILNTCPCCHTFNSQRSIIRPYLIGNDAATAVIATALYDELPNSIKTEKEVKLSTNNLFSRNENTNQKIITEEKLSKQFLTFSDNRQSAAFFASYLETTYRSNLIKRFCTEIADNNQQVLQKGISIKNFVQKLQSKFEQNKMYENEEEKKAWMSIITEFTNYKARNSLQNLGILFFDIDFKWDNDIEELGLKAKEVETLFKILLLDVIKNRAVNIPVDVTNADLEEFTPSGTNKIPCYNLESSKNVHGWIPKKDKTKNKRIKLLQQLFPNNETSELLEMIWNTLLDEKFLIQSIDKKNYVFNTNKIKVKSVDKLYYCPECKTITPYNLKNICPKCHKPLLQEYNYKEELKNNHYNYVFHHLNMDDIIAKEHTAQLGQDLAYDYQDKFKHKNINVLSCSTTFEMGVDVGSLETVFMRNMPPSPSNYAQRAGRAGRSVESAAYALTFCPNSSHDLNYFKNPTAMINGKINPPSFNLNNEKIIRRHIFASALSFFWKEYSNLFTKHIGEFFEQNGQQKFKEYLLQKPDNLKEYLLNVVSDEYLRKKFDIYNFGWVNDLFNSDNPDGIFDIACNKFVRTKKELEKQYLKYLNDRRELKANSIKKTINTLEEPDVIEFFSKNNIIPKYGFPVDSVELECSTEDKDTNDLRLNRDLINAISDYAPESEIVVNGRILKSRYIKKLSGYEWPLKNYIICPECGTLNERITDWDENENIQCKQCGNDLPKTQKRKYIIPKFGFSTETMAPKKASIIKPEKTYRGAISYIGNSTLEPVKKTFQIYDNFIEITSNKMDELAVINSSPFYVCTSCGYTVIDEDEGRKNHLYIDNIEHYNSYGYECKNQKLVRRDIGHEFQTDVVLIKTISQSITDNAQAWSILYSMLEGLSKYLPVARQELSGTLYWAREGKYQFVLFDNTPGGAGYVRQLTNPETFKGMLEQGYRIVKDCSCGGEEGDTACYSCLCNFYNQKQHNILKRQYAIDFYESLLDYHKNFEVDSVQKISEDSVIAIFNNDGQDQSQKSYREIWDYIEQDTDDEEEIKLFEKLKENTEIEECEERPFYMASANIADEKIRADLLWEQAKVMFFLKDNFENYQKAKQSNWQCFCINDNFSAELFIKAIKG